VGGNWKARQRSEMKGKRAAIVLLFGKGASLPKKQKHFHPKVDRIEGKAYFCWIKVTKSFPPKVGYSNV
jgi:hypothetical protein